MKKEKKRVSFNAVLSKEENERVQDYVSRLVEIGGFPLRRGDINGLILLTAIENPDFTSLVRNNIKKRLDNADTD